MLYRLFFIVILFTICMSCVKEQGADPATLYNSPDFIVKLKVNGLPVTYQQTVGGVIVDVQSIYTGTEDFEICSFLKKDNNANESFTIAFSKIIYNSPTQNQQDSLFSIGYYDNFGPSTSQKVSVEIEH